MSQNSKELCIQEIKSTGGIKQAGKFCYDLLKYILIAVEMIRIYSEYDVFTWKYKTHKSILAVETDAIQMDIQYIMCFEILTQ